MAKTKLFDLIKSMSMSEKRFFKIFSNRHVIGQENDYILLFDLIDKMNEFDEEAIRMAKFVKNASAEKNYLYNLVLRSLNTFHNQASSKIKIYDDLISAEVLFQKGLYDQSLELIKKTKEKAIENELFRQLLVVTELEQEVLLKKLDYEDAVNLHKEDRETFDKTANITDITYLTTKGYKENLSIGVARSDKQLDEFKELLKHPFLKNKNEALSHRARLHQMSLNMTYNMVAGEPKKVIEQISEIIEHYEKYPFLIEYTPIGYVSSNFILGAANRDNGKTNEAYKCVKKLNAAIENTFVKKSQKASAIAIYYATILELQLLLKENKFSDAIKVYDDKADQLKKMEVFISKPQLYDLYFQYCKLFFVTGNSKKTLKYTNEILNDIKFKDRDDFSITVRLFNLIVHFELDNDFTLEYLSKSTFSYLKRKDKLYEAERSIIKFLENYPKYIDQKQVDKELNALHEKLNELAKDKYEKGAFRLFDFNKWVESKIKHEKLEQLI